MRRLQQCLDTVSATVSGTLIGLLVIILSYNVFARFLGGGIQWYMETSQYFNVWAMFFVGISLCMRGEHLRINALEEILPGAGKKAIQLLVAAATVAFYLMLAYATFLLASRSKQVISTMTYFKMSYVYWPIPFLCLASAFSTVVNTILSFGGGGDPGKEKS
ncbi:MAG: TRAP transporter small permease subunit [Spirochaetia bacterium]|jgi:TRAP-type C4-dicarboxylate transport system permease small subunit|nr:TRAP transporter small permease subunit [Spirochaetia bacterium]